MLLKKADPLNKDDENKVKKAAPGQSFLLLPLSGCGGLLVARNLFI